MFQLALSGIKLRFVFQTQDFLTIQQLQYKKIYIYIYKVKKKVGSGTGYGSIFRFLAGSVSVIHKRILKRKIEHVLQMKNLSCDVNIAMNWNTVCIVIECEIDCTNKKFTNNLRGGKFMEGFQLESLINSLS